MALIKCSECKKEISDKAMQCVHCGASIEEKTTCEECGKETIKGQACKNCGYVYKSAGEKIVENNEKNKKIAFYVTFTSTVIAICSMFFLSYNLIETLVVYMLIAVPLALIDNAIIIKQNRKISIGQRINQSILLILIVLASGYFINKTQLGFTGKYWSEDGEVYVKIDKGSDSALIMRDKNENSLGRANIYFTGPRTFEMDSIITTSECSIEFNTIYCDDDLVFTKKIFIFF